jgi:hypothetical protein
MCNFPKMMMSSILGYNLTGDLPGTNTFSRNGTSRNHLHQNVSVTRMQVKTLYKQQILIYKTILKQIWTYGIQLWGTVSTSYIEILERFQSKALLCTEYGYMKGTLKMMYFSYEHSIITYGIIFWGNSPYSIKIFRMQKRIIRIIPNSTKRASCRTLFKELNILPLQAQYILSMSIIRNYSYSIHKCITVVLELFTICIIHKLT